MRIREIDPQLKRTPPLVVPVVLTAGSILDETDVMRDLLVRMWDEILSRPDGPLALRFYLQPLMSTCLAVIDGLRDVDERRPPFLMTLLTERRQRAALIADLWHSIGKIFLLACVLDVAYQLLELGAIRPVETLVVAVALAIIPYALVRGPVARIARRRRVPSGRL